MKKKLFFLLIVFLFILSNIFSSENTTNVNPDIAVITSYTGNVKVMRSSTPVAAKHGLMLKSWDDLQTGRASSVIVHFKNAVKIKVEENSRIIVNPVSNGNGNNYSITQYSGTVISKVIKLSSGATYEVNTPTSQAGVRGTNFTTMISIDGSTGVVVEHGKVNLIEKLNEQRDPGHSTAMQTEETSTQEQSVIVNAGQHATVSTEQDRIQVSRFQNAHNIRRTWIKRRHKIFRKRYPIILRRALRRMRRAIRLTKRAIRWTNFVERRLRRVEPRVERAIASGRPHALRRIRRKTRRLVRISRRIMRRLRIVRRRIRAFNFILSNIEQRMPNHPATQDTNFRKTKIISEKIVKKLDEIRPSIKQKIRYIRRTSRRWRRMIFEERTNGYNNRRQYRRRRFRRRRFRRRY